MDSFKGKNVIKWALSVGIIIVLNLFFAVGIETIYPQPEYNDFCDSRQVQEAYETKEACLAVGGQWSENAAPRKVPTDPAGWCNPDFTCSNAYQDASELYARDVFVALVVLGAVALAGGYALRVSPAVSAGLSYGGVLSFVIAAIRYWGEAGDLLRLVIVGVALIALIAIGVKKFKE